MSDPSVKRLIARNRRASYDYFLEKRYEAGIALEGWEVKGLRAGKAQIADAYVLIREGSAQLYGAHITPLKSTSTHEEANPDRVRALLLNKREISEIRQATSTRGRTCLVLSLYWRNGRVKCEIATATGKKKHDKRKAMRERDQKREAQRALATS